MPVLIIKKEDQVKGSFNGGKIKENRPVMMNDGKSSRPYSNIFYWAHAWSDEGSILGEHPHEGFEIMSFVLNGEIEHYDTRNKEWRLLGKGDMQIIRAGNGISHSENFRPGSEIFQIWVDPDLSKTLANPASYNDYKSGSFPVITNDEMVIKNYKGENSPLSMDTLIESIKEITFRKENITMELKEKDVYSVYLLEGKIELNDDGMSKDDYARIETEKSLKIKVLQENSKIFLIESPARPYYKTYYELFKQ
ncbi:MAG TPA: pirin family protein [Ignavibacteriaceae bacterium]|nr:pirin family protein [Ignavibacteriaceae bacterium]